MLLNEYEYLVVDPGTAAYNQYLMLRHEVFCEELKRVPSKGKQAGGAAVESDEFDVHSVHVLCRSRENGAAVGCSRLILPGPKGLNVTARYRLACLSGIPRNKIGEIGRMTLSSQLRRSRSSVSVICGEGYTDNGESDAKRVKRDGSMIAFGLYREMFRLLGQYGLTHCFAAMEPSLARLLNRLGFPFVEAGPLNTEVQPARQPYILRVDDVRAGIASRNAGMYSFMVGADGGEPVTAGAWQVQVPVPAKPELQLQRSHHHVSADYPHQLGVPSSQRH
jgi:N-acyl amino acid synthase of PEP-CTERM/exosortase system